LAGIDRFFQGVAYVFRRVKIKGIRVAYVEVAHLATFLFELGAKSFDLPYGGLCVLRPFGCL